jgi:hypothetical protein
LRDDFGIARMVMVGDRGMVSQKAIAAMRETEGIGWITALKNASIRALVEQGHLQMDLFDERNLVELRARESFARMTGWSRKRDCCHRTGAICLVHRLSRY